MALAVVTIPVRSTTGTTPPPPLAVRYPAPPDRTLGNPQQPPTPPGPARQLTAYEATAGSPSLLSSPRQQARMNGAVPVQPQKTHVGSRSTSRINSSMCAVGRAKSYTWNLRFRSRHSSDHSLLVLV